MPAAKEITHLPIVVDPSHATFLATVGKTNVTCTAVASGAQGIMLEVHLIQKNSAVDPLQPIDYKEFNILMKDMHKLAKNFI